MRNYNFKDYDLYDPNEFDLSTFSLETHDETIRFLIKNFDTQDLVYQNAKGYFWKSDNSKVRVKDFKQFQD